MSRTAIGVFEPVEAERVLDELVREGYGTDGISVLSHDETETQPESTGELPEASEGLFGAYAEYLVDLRGSHLRGIGAAVLAGPIAEKVEQGEEAEGDSLLAALIEEGVPASTASAYCEGVRRGGALVAIRVPDEDLPGALDVLKRHHARITEEQKTEERRASTMPRRESTPIAKEGVERAAGDVSMPVMDEDEATDEEEEMSVTGVIVEPKGERAPGFEEREGLFREHFRQLGPTGGTYEQYSPAYRYGYALRHRIGDQGEWSEVEPHAKSEWESHNPNTWERFKASVRHAWEKATKKES
jgi:hypothetical protein